MQQVHVKDELAVSLATDLWYHTCLMFDLCTSVFVQAVHAVVCEMKPLLLPLNERSTTVQNYQYNSNS